MKTIQYDPAKIRLYPSLQRSEPFFQDSSAYVVLTDCRRRYFYKHVLGRVPLEGDPNQRALDFGSYYHKFRELLETHGYSEAMQYILQLPPSDLEPKSRWGYLDDKRLVKTCQAAADHWKKEKEQGKFEVIAVEQPFNIEVFPGYFIGGRADQIVKWNGRIWGRDFKTTSKDEGTFSKMIDPNDQAMRYIFGESKLHGEEVQGILFEAVFNDRKNGPIIYTKTSKRNDFQKEQWLEQIKLDSEQLNQMREKDIWPMDTGRKCVWCPFHIVCRTGNPESQENILRSKFKFSPWDHTKVDQESE